MKLSIEIFIFFLNFAIVRCYVSSRYPLIDKFCSNFSLMYWKMFCYLKDVLKNRVILLNTVIKLSRIRSFTLNRPTSFCLNRNCLFKLLMSIVSMSITSIFLKPISARSFNNSHPNPPAPTTRTRTNSCKALNISSDGSKLSPLKGPLRFNNFWTWFHLPGQSCCSLSKISLSISYGALLLEGVEVRRNSKFQ